MYSSESAWMFSSCAWRPSTSLSSDAVTSSRTTWITLSPTIPSAAEKYPTPMRTIQRSMSDSAVCERHCSTSRCIGTSSGSQWFAFMVR